MNIFFGDNILLLLMRISASAPISFCMQQLFHHIETQVHYPSKETMKIINHFDMESPPDTDKVCKNDILERLVEGNMSTDDGSDEVFEIVFSTDKTDFVASHESISTFNPLMI